jgi:cAMP-binding proteins - catabolite gene activator and regulatory subunit of cAMP-dependent protein kinases
MGSDQTNIRNKVLLATRPEARAFLAEVSELRPILAGQVLYRDGDEVTHAILPHDGIISLTAPARDRIVEQASIGVEGFVGFNHLMGGTQITGNAQVVVDGYATWISLRDLNRGMENFVCVRDAMLVYANSLIVQLMESVLCNSLHPAEQRVARWLVMASQRMAEPVFNLTQDTLAQLLGLRRATVSQISAQLAEIGAITYSRGRLHILDVERLERYTCECFRRIRLGLPERSLQPQA